MQVEVNSSATLPIWRGLWVICHTILYRESNWWASCRVDNTLVSAVVVTARYVLQVCKTNWHSDMWNEQIQHIFNWCRQFLLMIYIRRFIQENTAFVNLLPWWIITKRIYATWCAIKQYIPDHSQERSCVSYSYSKADYYSNGYEIYKHLNKCTIGWNKRG